MSTSQSIKCPSCGAYLEYDPQSRAFTCPYCNAEISAKQLDHEEERAAAEAAFDARIRTWHCDRCGAELVTDDTTAATRCYYCHAPAVVTERLSGSFRPDGVIPFKISREEAEKAFQIFLSNHKYVDKRFFTSDQLESMTGVYYPYWLGDFAGEGVFDGEGIVRTSITLPRETVITSKYYAVHREGHLVFRNVVRKALGKVDRQLSDGIHPYDLTAVEAFDPRYLSGFMADMRDTDEGTARADMLQEVNGYTSGLMQKRESFTTLNGKSRFTLTGVSMRYLLLPAWVITYRGDQPGKTYYFMMNGQDGKVCGRLPIRKARLWLTSALTGAGVAAAMLLIGRLITHL